MLLKKKRFYFLYLTFLLYFVRQTKKMVFKYFFEYNLSQLYFLRLIFTKDSFTHLGPGILPNAWYSLTFLQLKVDILILPLFFSTNSISILPCSTPRLKSNTTELSFFFHCTPFLGLGISFSITLYLKLTCQEVIILLKTDFQV